jgi:hypothetical protein
MAVVEVDHMKEEAVVEVMVAVEGAVVVVLKPVVNLNSARRV